MDSHNYRLSIIHYPLLLLIVCFLSTTLSAYAGEPKLSKSTKREYQKTLKQMTEEGWTVWGKSLSLDKALMAHFIALERQGLEATTFESRGKAASANAAYRKASHNASVQMALLKGGSVEGGAETHITNKSGEVATSQTDFEASYRSSTAQNVNSLKPTISLCREQDGSTEILLLYVVK